MPSAPSEEEKKEEVEEKKSDGMTIYPEVLEELSKLLGAEDYKSLVEYVEGLKNGSVEKDKWLVLTEEFTDKERRAAIHTFFKEKVKLYETDTIVQGQSRKIQLFLKSSLSNNQRKRMKMGDRKKKDPSIPDYLKVAL